MTSDHVEVSHEASSIIRNHGRYPSRCCNHHAVVALTFDRASCRRYGHRSLQEFTQPDRRKGFRTIALLSAKNALSPRRQPEDRGAGWRCAFPGKLFQNGGTEQNPANRAGLSHVVRIIPAVNEAGGTSYPSDVVQPLA